MSDDTNNQAYSAPVPNESTPETPSDTERVGFCQNCGRPLTKGTIRTVGTGIFCEPCLEARVNGTGYGVPPVPPVYAAVPPPPAAAPGDPSPLLAGLLGLIPGVGAIYNGQYAKGVVHLIIFAVLESLSQNVSSVFGLFVFGWIVYQAFEAYHTAIARRDGLPLPNAFGFNDIGERMGFGKTWGVVGSARVNPAAAAGPATVTPPPPPAPGAYLPTGTIPVGTAPDWVGYVPPTVFGGAAAPPAPPQQSTAEQAREQAAHNAGYASYAAYAETFTGTYSTYPAGPAVPPPYVVAPTVPTRRFPIGAIWLIALGALILIGNLIPDWRMSGRWLLPVLFVGLAAWSLSRSLRTGVSLVCLLRWPVVFTVLAVLFGLQAAYVATLGQTWPVLFIALGIVLLLERTAGVRRADPLSYPAAPSGYASVVPPSVVPQPPVVEETPARAAWAEAETTKDGH